MPWWQAILDSLGLVAGLAALGFLYLFVRRRVLSRSGGTFECSVRVSRPASPGNAETPRGWMLGLGRYNGDSLEWFRIFSFSPRPRYVFTRAMTVLGRRIPHGAEAFALYAGHQVVDVSIPSGRHVEIAMSQGALTGFLAWTEAAPPGHERLLT